MPKTPSNKLFRLIKSLSGSEKRYFKLFIPQRDDKSNKYLLLFDAIDQQEEFEEEVLKKTVYGDQEISSRKYSELKSYLYDLVVKSLQSYDEKTSIDYRMKHALLGVRALYKRSHFSDAQTLLSKARKIAVEYEQYHTQLEILWWEKQIAYAQTNIAYLDRELNRIDSEEKECLQKLGDILSYRNTFYRILISLRKDASLRTEQQVERLEEIMSHPLLAADAKPASYFAKVLYDRCYSLYHFAKKDFQAFYETSARLIDLMESKPHFLKEDVSEYISALNNFIFSCGWLNKYEEVAEKLSVLKAVSPNTLDDELKIHRQYYMNKFGLCIMQGDFEEGKRAVEQHERDIRKFSEVAFRKNTFFFQFFYIYFGSGDYNEALRYLNEWLNLSGNIERKDLQSLSRILNLIVHYEMGNTMLLESLVRSSYRFLRKQQHIYAYERRMLTFFKNLDKWVSKSELKQAYKDLKADLLNLFQSEEDRTTLELFDVVAWVESKIQNKPFAEIIQTKYRERLDS